jgi:regulator of RNase E activity RraA
MMNQASDTLVARLWRLSVADVADEFDKRALVPPVLAKELCAIGRAQKFAGIAFCIEGRKLNAAGRLAMPTGRDPLYDSLDDRVPAGAVLLYATGSYDDAAVLGGGLALSLQRRGVSGVIVDGMVRDGEEIAQCALPVLARGSHALRFVGRFAMTAIDAPIDLRGVGGMVTANTGDLVLADHDGAIVIPAAIAADIVAGAEQVAALNEKVTTSVLAGMSRAEAARVHGKR